MSTRTARGAVKPVEAATLICKATVTRVNASNEPTVPSGPGLIVARVDAVIKASPDLGDLVGRSITIQLANRRPPMKKGQQAIFYATDWVFGRQIAVRELAHTAAIPGAERKVSQALAVLPATHLATRVRTAELMIVGAIAAIKPSPLDEPLSFNAPQWRVASVSIESVLKSAARQPSSSAVEVLFPGSDDWAPAPQFKKNQRGIFLLRHERKLGIPPEYFTALDPADFQPMKALDQVQSLLKK